MKVYDGQPITTPTKLIFHREKALTRHPAAVAVEFLIAFGKDITCSACTQSLYRQEKSKRWTMA
jgi:hypothetical protein